MKMYGILVGVAALTVAAGAQAQTVGAPAPISPPAPPAPELRGPDDRVEDFTRMRNDISGRPRTANPVPARPEDVKTGSPVRDSKGALIGTVGTVGMGYAVVESPAGKVEVEFASFAKNNKGLLINMPKAKFDAIVSGNATPKK